MNSESIKNRPAGYLFLTEKYHLDVVPNWHSSLIQQTGAQKQTIIDNQVQTRYPSSYWPGAGTGDHLEFALKYDGVNLGILSALFEKIPPKEITEWILSKPKGKYARRIWFFFEFLTGSKLPLPDVTTGNYIDILEPDRYYTTSPGIRIQRQRVMNNLLGSSSFCPVIRRTDKLSRMDTLDVQKRCEEVLTAYPPELLKRALSYLYNKETKSSFEIEHLKPGASRTEKFVGLLEIAESRDFCDKSSVVALQNRIVDPRFQDTGYRTTQNYVGQSISYQREILHHVCPKPEDIDDLMKGLFHAHRALKESAIPAVIHAAIIAYGFVFMHPFEDGNGRIHRFLIHNILFLRKAVPEGLMFPVSAAMIKKNALYDQSLERFSKPLLNIIDYDLDEFGRMTVHGETGRWYRYIDMTAQAEILYDFVTFTLEEELVEELDFLASFEKSKRAIQEIADIPDRLIDLFIQCCLQNHGHLSSRKREAHFNFLTDEEQAQMERAVQEGYAKSLEAGR
jgi:Fic family protein